MLRDSARRCSPLQQNFWVHLFDKICSLLFALDHSSPRTCLLSALQAWAGFEPRDACAVRATFKLNSRCCSGTTLAQRHCLLPSRRIPSPLYNSLSFLATPYPSSPLSMWLVQRQAPSLQRLRDALSENGLTEEERHAPARGRLQAHVKGSRRGTRQPRGHQTTTRAPAAPGGVRQCCGCS